MNAPEEMPMNVNRATEQDNAGTSAQNQENNTTMENTSSSEVAANADHHLDQEMNTASEGFGGLGDADDTSMDARDSEDVSRAFRLEEGEGYRTGGIRHPDEAEPAADEPADDEEVGGEPGASDSRGEVAVTYFRNHRATGVGARMTIAEVCELIRNPHPEVRETVRRIRQEYALAGGGRAGKEAAREMKSALPCIMPSALGSRREPTAATGLVGIDIDGLGERLPGVRSMLENCAHVALGPFLSPSGDGLKAVFLVPVVTGDNPGELMIAHRRQFSAVREYCGAMLAIKEIDSAPSNLVSLCYLTHDENCRLNLDAVPLDTDAWHPAAEDERANRSGDPGAKDGADVAENASEEVVEALLNSIPPRPDYDLWMRLTAASRNILGDDDRAIAILKAWSPEEHRGEYRALLRSSSFSRIGRGTLVYHARRNGFVGVLRKFFYDGKAFYMRQGDIFIPLTESGVKQHIRTYGVDPNSRECPLCLIRSGNFVPFVGEVAGHGIGIHEFNGSKFLVTRGPTIIEATGGGGGHLMEFVRALLAPCGEEQVLCFLAWLQRARRAVISGRRTQIPALAIAGDAGDGKSLLIEVVAHALGGRKAGAYRYLSGATQFNAAIVGSELLVVDDEAANPAKGARGRFAQFLKTTLFSGSVRAEAKGREAVECAPAQALMMTVNVDPEHLRVLPELDATMRDKIVLLKSSPSPVPPDIAGRNELVARWVMQAMPGFLGEVETFDSTDWVSPATGRLRCLWNQDILQRLDQLSPENRLLGLIFETPAIRNALALPGGNWTGTATELAAILLDQDSPTRHDARALLSWSGACGTYLSRLADNGNSGVTYDGLTTGTRIQRYRMVIPENRSEESEETFSPSTN